MNELIKFKVVKDHPTVDGMLYKDEVVMVETKYESFIKQEKTMVQGPWALIQLVEI